MGKVAGRREGTNSVVRKTFTGDPGTCQYIPVRDPDPRHAKPGYKDRVRERATQGSPCGKTQKHRGGPSKREPGTGQESWRKLLETYGR